MTNSQITDDPLILKCMSAKRAASVLANSQLKNSALEEIGRLLEEKAELIIEANKKDLTAITQNKQKEGKMTKAMLDRLTLDKKRIESMVEGVKQIINLPDPVGEIVEGNTRPNGLIIQKKRVPLGVIGIIYESRPNVTVDSAALCLKAGNAVVLRGGSEAINSNIILAQIMRTGLKKCGLPMDCINIIEEVDRKSVLQMMKLNQYIDVLIPRGGAGLISTVVNNATVPVIQTGTGNCHVYIDAECDASMAERIIVNAKASRPSVCNAAETLLVHKRAAQEYLHKILTCLHNLNVEIIGCPHTLEIFPQGRPATDEDWSQEYLDYKLAVKIVDSLDQAIDHINEYGTKHSEAIVTNNYINAQRFVKEIDAAAVYVNASTRFTDGYEFGFGAEIGISNQKMHARGPMGLKELTTTKYIVYGEGQIR